MSSAPALAASPSFEKARTLSRWLKTVFTVLFWLTAFYLVAAVALTVIPVGGSLFWEEILISFPRDDLGKRALLGLSLWIGVLPSLLLFHHARRLFSCFAAGKVFSATSVAHIRAAGLWLVISAGAALAAKTALYAINGIQGDIELNVQSVIFGATTFVAAHVMGEAQRIADENASIL